MKKAQVAKIPGEIERFKSMHKARSVPVRGLLSVGPGSVRTRIRHRATLSLSGRFGMPFAPRVGPSEAPAEPRPAGWPGLYQFWFDGEPLSVEPLLARTRVRRIPMTTYLARCFGGVLSVRRAWSLWHRRGPFGGPIRPLPTAVWRRRVESMLNQD